MLLFFLLFVFVVVLRTQENGGKGEETAFLRSDFVRCHYSPCCSLLSLILPVLLFFFPLIFRCFYTRSQNYCEKRLIALTCLSVCMEHREQQRIESAKCNILDFTNVCLHISVLFEIGQN